MIDIASMTAVLFAGLLLGIFFFGGLLWTVGKGLSAKHPVILFYGSLFIRLMVVLGVFYLVSDGRWERMVVCAVGFIIPRFFFIRYARTAAKPKDSKQEGGDAS